MKHLKPKSGVWLHFTEVTAEGGSKKAQCNLCSSGPGKSPWLTVPNATRMTKHLSEKPRIKPEEDSAQHNPSTSSSSSTASSPAELNEVRTPARAEGRPCSQERVGFEKLSREVKLRFNYLRLQEGTVNP